MSEMNFELLDLELEELADLEKFEVAPKGSYSCQLNWERKEINEQPAVIAKFKILETLELSDSTAKAPEPGKVVDIALILTRKDKDTQEVIANKMGQGQLKEILKELAPTVGGTKPAEIMENSQGATVAVTFGVRPNKNDPDSPFQTLKSIVLA